VLSGTILTILARFVQGTSDKSLRCLCGVWQGRLSQAFTIVKTTLIRFAFLSAETEGKEADGHPALFKMQNITASILADRSWQVDAPSIQDPSLNCEVLEVQVLATSTATISSLPFTGFKPEDKIMDWIARVAYTPCRGPLNDRKHAKNAKHFIWVKFNMLDQLSQNSIRQTCAEIGGNMPSMSRKRYQDLLSAGKILWPDEASIQEASGQLARS